MPKKHGPGCPCCTCKIDSLSPETAVTGDVVRPGQHPQSPYPAWLQAEVKAAVGDTLKLFLAWDESSPGDGLYIEFTPQNGATNGTLKLYRKDATQLGTTLQLLCADETYWHLITACYDPDTDEFTACFDARDSRGYVVRGQCVSATVPTGFAAGTKAGYGGTGSIKNYKYDRLWYYTSPQCPVVETVTEGSDNEAYSSVHTWEITDENATATVQVVNPVIPGGSEIVTWDGSVENPAEAFESTINSFLASIATDGETWTIACELIEWEPGVWHLTATATGDLANRMLRDPDLEIGVESEQGWIYDLETSPDFSAYSYTRGDPGPLNEVQRLTVYDNATFALTYGGQTTSDLPATSTAGEIQSALEALSSIGSGNVTVTGSNPWDIEFVGTLAETNVAEITVTSDGCCTDDSTGDYYYDPLVCPRTYCHGCGSPSCTVVSETFAEIEGTAEAPGDMPCGWDVDGTDWNVIDGKATGNGEVCHEFDTTGGSYHVAAEFDFGHLETQGDAVTVSLTHGDRTLSLTYTRVAGQPWTVIGYAATDLLAFSGFADTPENGTAVTFSVGGGGSLPAPLLAGVTYYIRDKSGNSVKVAATLGGDAIDLTTDSIAPMFCDDPPDRYALTSNIPGSTTQYLASMLSLPLNICPSLICFGTDYVLQGVTPGPVCVSITQPTMSGHEDASLISFSITRGYSETDTQCPACTCKITCNDCENPFLVYVDLGEAFLTAQRTCEGCNDVQGLVAAQYYGDMGTYCAWSYAVAYCTCTHPTCADKVPPHNKTSLSFWITLSTANDPEQGVGFVWQLGASWFRVTDPSDTCKCGGGNVGYASGWQPTCELPISLELHRQDPVTPEYEFCGQTGLPFPNPLGPGDGEGCECIGEWPLIIRIGSQP